MSNVNISQQVPNHIQAEYPAFVEFVQAYYDWLKITYSSKLEDIVDIEQTPEQFLKYFKKQIAMDIPEEIYGHPRLFYQKIKDLYNAKGTESAYKLLFRLVYGEESEIIYPHEQILRVSDGRWIQDTSIFVKLTYGNIDDVFENYVTLQTELNRFDIYIKKIRPIDIGNGIYELFINNEYSGNISINDVIITATLKAVVIPTITSVRILSPGRDFRVGDIFTVDSPSGTPSTIKVIEIGPNGTLVRIQPIKFGYNYAGIFINYVIAPINKTTKNLTPFTEVTSSSVYSSEYYYDMQEEGFINKQNYFETKSGNPVWDSTYVGEVIGEFIFDNAEGSLDEQLYAKLQLDIGAVAKYPGYYATNDGFLDDLMYIQDSYYYQDFSYAIRLNKQLNEYKDLLKNTLHPGGLILFGEFDILNELSIELNIQKTGTATSLALRDQILVFDTRAFAIEKSLYHVQDVRDTYKQLITRPLSDSTNELIDYTSYNFNKRAFDSQQVTDYDKFTATLKKVDSSYVSDNNRKDYTTSKIEIQFVEDFSRFNFITQFYDNSLIQDTTKFTYHKPVFDESFSEEFVKYSAVLPKFDSVSQPIDYTKLAIGLSKTDSVESVEFESKYLDAKISDSFQTVEAVSKLFQTSTSDTLLITDSSTKAFGKYAFSGTAINDVFYRNFIKNLKLSDNIALVENNSSDIDRQVLDNFNVSDSLSIVAYQAVYLMDSVKILDTLKYSFNKPLNDVSLVQDALTYQFTRYVKIFDDVTIDDITSKHISAFVSDATSSNDITSLQFNRTFVFSDSLQTLDSLSKSIGISSKDTETVVDKAKFEFVSAVYDMAELQDSISKSATKSLINSLIAQDYTNYSYTKALQDSEVVVDEIEREIDKYSGVNEVSNALDAGQVFISTQNDYSVFDYNVGYFETGVLADF